MPELVCCSKVLKLYIYKFKPLSRYRPPGKPTTALITAEGYEVLQLELKALWVRRRGVTEAVTVAEGDRSENAEYIYRKKELR